MKILILMILLALFIMVFMILNHLYKKTNHYKNCIWQVDKFKDVPDNIEIAAVGSGPGLHDISFEGLNKKGFNFCMAPLSYEYSYKILKQYQSKIKPSALIMIIVTSPLSFAKNLNYRRKDYYDVFYHFLKPENITNYSRFRKFLTVFPILKNPKNVFKIWRDTGLWGQQKLYSHETLTKEQMENSINRAMQGWLAQTTLSNLTDEKQSAYQEEEFEKRRTHLENILKLCDENAWRPVFVIPPMCEEINQQVSESFEQRFVMDQLKKINTNQIPILNYFRDAEFSKDKYYQECYFMNVEGKRKFSKKLFQDMEQYYKMENDINEKICEHTIELSNGVRMPNIAYGTGVIRRYYRNKKLFLKDSYLHVKSSIKNRRIEKKLLMDWGGVNVMRKAYQAGFCSFDTGRLYGHSELMIGKLMKKVPRNQYFVTTKIIWPELKRKWGAPTVEGSLNISLKYLQTDYVDLYLVHMPNGNWIEIYQQMEKLYEKGLTRAIGVCNVTVEQLEELRSQCSITPHVVQAEIQPLNSKRELREYCKKNNIVLEAHTPTGRVSGEIRENEVLKSLAQKHKKTIAQIILRWHFQNGVIPVVFTTSQEHMKENLDIYDFELSHEEMESIESLNEDYVMLPIPKDDVNDKNYFYNL